MNQELMNIHEQAMEKLKPVFREMEDISLKNTQKVLEAFRRHQKSWKKSGPMYFRRKQPW